MRIDLSGRHARRMTAVVAVMALASLSACASEPPPRPARLDPSNPSAPEAPAPSLTPLQGSGPVADAPVPVEERPASSGDEHDHGAHEGTAPAPAAPVGGAQHHHGAAQEKGGDASAKPRSPAATTYTCPMHPEVTSDKPGRCPKCGMNLVPRKPASGGKP